MSHGRRGSARKDGKSASLTSLLLGLLAAAALLVVPSAAQAAAQAKTADSFIESIGVNVHTAYGGTPYVERFGTVEQRLEELGVRHVRDDLEPDRPGQYQALNDLASAGIKSTVILGDPTGGTAGLEKLIGAVKTDLAGSVEAVEGPNEFSTSGDPAWKSDLIAYQQRLYEDVKGDPGLSSLPVIGPSIVHGDQEELGDISGSLDYGNIHSYPEGNPPDKLGPAIARAELNSGPKPIIATETGYTTAIHWTPAGNGENRPISEQAMATYMPRLFFEYFRWGIPRTFSYELVDERPDPDLDEKEADFGLLRNDLSEKPAFAALSNTIHILEDPGPAFIPGLLDYTLSDEGTELHEVLLQKRDGSFYLALWRPSSVWNPIATEALPAMSEPVTLSLQPGIQSAEEYQPNLSPDPIGTLSLSAGPVTVEVGPEVVVIKLTPESDSSPPQPAHPKQATERIAVRSCVVPRLKGKKLNASKKKLKAAGCKLGKVKRLVGASAKSGTVARQNPKPGKVLARGTKVNIDLAPVKRNSPHIRSGRRSLR